MSIIGETAQSYLKKIGPWFHEGDAFGIHFSLGHTGYNNILTRDYAGEKIYHEHGEQKLEVGDTVSLGGKLHTIAKAIPLDEQDESLSLMCESPNPQKGTVYLAKPVTPSVA